MGKKDMILALIDHYSNGNKAQFANLVGITPQGLSTWIKRETFDIELIFSKCEGISSEWLLSGEGAMLRTEGGASDNTPAAVPVASAAGQSPEPLVADLITKIATQAEEIGRLKARIEELERRRGDDAGRAKIFENANVG